MSLIKVEDALVRLLTDCQTMDCEQIPLALCPGRILGEDLVARRNQPPFNASAMDGYAVKAENCANLPARLQVVGEVPAGYHFPDMLQNWEAVRIFTGAPVPEGADAILIQENATREGAFVTALEPVKKGLYIRPAGLDFKEGDVQITKGTRLNARNLALAASMNHATLPVFKRPKIAILATGDELVQPGEIPNQDQIIASNTYGVAALVDAAGGEAISLGIAKDRLEDITAKINEAQAQEADSLVTIGGASVGDHDLVQQALTDAGMALDFWRIAMRPGKPLMAGQLGDMRVLGLPGNPVSSMVCTILFLLPLIRAMCGDANPQPIEEATLGGPLSENDKRQSYLRATLKTDRDGRPIATPFDGQDSAMMALFAKADCLIIHPPHAPKRAKGTACDIIRL